MTSPSVPAGATLFAEAIRVTALDAVGAPLWGATSFVQTKNVVSLAYTYDMQAGVDLTKTNGKGEVCLSWRGNDTKKRINVTLNVCDEDLFMKQLLVGGTLFTGSDVRTVTDGVTATSTSLVSATAAFTSEDVGATVSGTGIFAGSTIASVTNATTAVLSHVTTATATGVTVTITGPAEVEGYQGPKVGEVGRPNGCSVEVLCKHVVGDVAYGYEVHAFPMLYFNDNDKTLGPDFADMSFVGWGRENANWGSGPQKDFDHDSTGLTQHIFVPDLWTPLQEGFQVISSS